MRTTVELSSEHRAKLMDLAAKRGEKGFSGVLAAAVDSYLHEQEEELRRVRGAAAWAAFEQLTPEFGDELARNLEEARKSWRS